MVMDLPGDGLLINTYLKWNPSANSGVGGWFEFLADGDASTYDNGAELVDLDGDERAAEMQMLGDLVDADLLIRAAQVRNGDQHRILRAGQADHRTQLAANGLQPR